jgi:glycosyltransferase involved in cell wall biosynthesis
MSLTHSYRGAGINGYIVQLLHHLPAGDPRDCAGDDPFRYTAFLHDSRFEAPARLAVSRSRWSTSNPWRRIIWEQTSLSGISRKLDLLHGLAFAAPLSASCPTVVTVHDLSFLRFPSAFRPHNRIYLTLLTRASTRRAARVIAVSESTRQDVILLCGVPPEKILAIPNGVNPEFSPADPAAVAEFRRDKGLPDRYILYLGTLEPRKNVVRLVDAYARLRSAPSRPGGLGGTTVRRSVPPMVIAGAKGWFYGEIFARVAELNLTDYVLFPGFIPGEELPWWYRGAEVFVYPSLFEGFGLPVLEAMACGTPTITSTASSLPEVAGDAAILVNPDDTNELAEAMHQVLVSPNLAEQLRCAGPRQAAHFSWMQTAASTRDVYRAALGLERHEGSR